MSTDPPTCTLCRPGWTCPWCDMTAEERAEQDRQLREREVLRHLDDYGGLEVSAARYANYVRERERLLSQAGLR